jgi:hypothetical protein
MTDIVIFILVYPIYARHMLKIIRILANLRGEYRKLGPGQRRFWLTQPGYIVSEKGQIRDRYIEVLLYSFSPNDLCRAFNDIPFITIIVRFHGPKL